MGEGLRAVKEAARDKGEERGAFSSGFAVGA